VHRALLSEGGSARALIPLTVTDKLRTLRVRMSVPRTATSVTPTIDGNNLGLTFEAVNESYVAEVETVNCALLEPLSFQLCCNGNKQSEVFISDSKSNSETATDIETNYAYFAVNDYPEAEVPVASKPNVAVGSLCVLWDASFSMDKVDRSKEKTAVVDYAKAMRFSSVCVVPFSNTTHQAYRSNDMGKVADFIEQVVYDGGTDLKNLNFPDGYTHYLLCTDGFSTLSPDLPACLPSAPVHVLIGAVKCNMRTMRVLAESTGGSCFQLHSLGDTRTVVQQLVHESKFKFLYASYDSNVLETFPDHPVATESVDGHESKKRQKLQLYGRVLPSALVAGVEITLCYGFEKSKPLVTRKVCLTARDICPAASTNLARQWAQCKIEQIQANGDANMEENMLALGRQFGIVTPGASLLVLTDLQQYLEHDIPPDKNSLPQLFAQFTAKRRKEKEDLQSQVDRKLKELDRYLIKRKEWYERPIEQVKRNCKSLWKSAHLKGMAAKRCTYKEEEDESSDGEDCKMLDNCSAMMKSPPPLFDACVSKSKVNQHPYPPPPPLHNNNNNNNNNSSKNGSSSSSSSSSSSHASSETKLNAWVPDNRHVNAMKEKVTVEDKYLEYIRQRSLGNSSSSPAFYLDCSSYLATCDGGGGLAVRILTTLADLRLENDRLQRIVANKLWQEGGSVAELENYVRVVQTRAELPLDLCYIVGEYLVPSKRPVHKGAWGKHFLEGEVIRPSALLQAKYLFSCIVKTRGDEPQSHRELALCLADLGELQGAVDKLWHVLSTEWPIRFQHIEDEVFLEFNSVLGRARKAGMALDLSKIPNHEKYIYPMQLGVRCTITWDTDDTCIDLHIRQPGSIECCYDNHDTGMGGWSTPDYPGCPGYSTSMLREYIIRHGVPGEYTLSCNYYSNSRQDLTGGTVIWFTVYTNFMMDDEKRTCTALRLASHATDFSQESYYEIGKVQYGVSDLMRAWHKEWSEEFASQLKPEFAGLVSEHDGGAAEAVAPPNTTAAGATAAGCVCM